MSEAVSFPVCTDRLRLRRHIPGDCTWLHSVYSRPDVARYLLDEPWTIEDAERHAAERAEKTDLDGDSGALALIIERDDEPIGDVTLWFTDRKRRVAEIGWVLDPGFGGHGYAAEAVRAVLDLAFDHYRAHRVAAQMDGRNAGSAKLAASVGMRQEAHLRQDWWSKGEWTDTLIYAILATDR
ncbi:GNAT family N-acetyltransferase [Ruania alba]|uniref:Protein N-acetyltransferase, RimJ/RimL family n=1 Tax=Ruania alba TaxID=648782 RepID=A0A1H5DGT0_9MICO|nr:GNAT family N-acetyltransferase [Ruania alba]SED78064.1 Protein N-acetyltransferase, RimJ/RimL family [Ruania alba]